MNPNEKKRASDKDRLKQQDQEFAELNHLLRQATPPLSADQLEPRIDLWPRLRSHIDSRHAADSADANSSRESSRIHARIPWFDWALAALAAAALLIFPGIIPALLYHF